MSKRKMELGLGRGLNALLGDPEIQNDSEGSVSLPISQIEPGLNQPRKRFNPESLAELTQSIRTHGIIQPLTVRRLSTGYYQIIAGERRWRAAKAAGLIDVPAVIIEADDRKVMEIGLIENLQREDLNAIEEADGIKYLMTKYGLTQEEVSERVGKSRSAVAKALRLLKLPESISEYVRDGIISAGHAKALLPLENEEKMVSLCNNIIKDNLSVRETEKIVKMITAEKKNKNSGLYAFTVVPSMVS